MIVQENSFDSVHDCQKVFRELLHAISNPGDVGNIAEYAKKIKTENGALIAIAHTLLDSKNSFYMIGEGVRKEALSGLTRAVHSDTGPKFIFVVSECGEEEREKSFAIASPGSIVEPHKNTVLFIFVQDLNETCRLSGPGIDGIKTVLLSKYALAWLQKRDQMEYEYPSGLDIFFVSPKGDVIAIPRKIRVEG